MITKNKLAEIRDAFVNSARPLIFFDDDPDGLCSFLQFYKLNPEAKGVIYKVAGPLDAQFLKKVDEHNPDMILILDVAVVDQSFLDKCHNVYWLDHHAPLKRSNVKYYNPMIDSKGKDNRPVSYWSHLITKSSIWLAMTGCVGDWFLPDDLRPEFSQTYEDLLPTEIKTPEEALFNSGIGSLANALSFVLKGTTKDSMTNTKVMTRIKEPYEILQQSSEQGRFIWKKYLKVKKIYDNLKSAIKVTDDKLIVFTYSENRTSLTSDLSNEILFENPDKFVIIARIGGSEMKCSLRSSKYKVLEILNQVLKEVNGYGGGHLHACGANVKIEDFDRFLDLIRMNLN
ncbi:MAG: DHH family phosphoesterase [archaeon]